MFATRLPSRHLAIGLIIRELLAPWTGHPYDFEIWTRLGYYMQTLSNPYTVLPYVPGLSFAPFARTGSISYPPFSAFIFGLIYRAYFLLGSPSRFLYYFLLKQPMVFADIGVAIVLARTIQLTGDTRQAKTAFLVWLYLPLGIVVSSIWGQLDPLSLLLSLLAVYYFLRSKWVPSAVTLGLSIYLKTLPVVFLPVFLLQAQTRPRTKLGYSIVSISIPLLGTLLPIVAFNWGIQGVYNNFSFQAAIPRTGAMSFLGQVHVLPSLLSLVHPITGIVWMPVLLAAYAYIWKRHLPLVQGLLIAILAFSISRPFLPEQWSLYPLALLLLVASQTNLGHFIGLTVSATGFLLANNNLLVRFFTPVSVAAFNWDLYAPYQPPYGTVRDLFIVTMSFLYFTESLLILLQRESIVHRFIISAIPARLLPKPRVAPTEVRFV
jgi:hypothetical protein